MKNCNSLRDIEDFLMANQNECYHLNIKGQPVRSTISHANNKRDWLFYDLFNYLYRKRKSKICFEENPIKIIDSIVIIAGIITKNKNSLSRILNVSASILGKLNI